MLREKRRQPKMIPMRVMMEMKLPSRIRKKVKWFISSCDALVSFLVSCHERGTLDQVLRESRFAFEIDA